MPRILQRGDYTGAQAERLQKEHAGELAERQGQIGLVNELAPEANLDGIFDPVTGQLVDADGALEVSPEDELPVEDMSFNGDGGYRLLRVNTDIEQMTYGVGNTFDLKRGKRYRVSEDLYQWLDSKGLVV
jgi:hypothetical protein